jgi:hypothetical protein
MALAAAALELAVRIGLALDRNAFDEALVRPRPPRSGRELALFDLLRSHPDDRVVYELRPGVRGTFLGQELAINSLGMRDVERSFAKAPGTFRIAGLGDSHAFGWGVRQDETYLAVLERLLSQRFPQRHFEVWNLAVPGYNTVQEVRAFELRMDAIDPDLVIINYVDNDMDLPNFLALRPNLWSLRKLYLVDVLRRRLAVLRDEAIGPFDLIGVPPDPRSGRYRMDPARIPSRYRPLVGWDNMVAAFLHLRALTAARHIPLVVLFNPDDYRGLLLGRVSDARIRPARELGERLAREGAIVVDPQPRIVQYLRDHGLPASALWIRDTDSHTNPLRHRLLAEALMEALVGARAVDGGGTRGDDGS